MNAMSSTERPPEAASGERVPPREVLSIRNLSIRYRADTETVKGADLTVRTGETVGLIGESGSGKSSVALGCLGLLPKTTRVTADRFSICGQSVLTMGEDELTRLRGGTVAMVFQDAMGSLNPSMRIGNQIAEVVGRHRGTPKGGERRAAVLDLLDKVGVPEPDRRARQYPHQLSGGLRQRAAVALALAGGPDLLVADEPTTALDVTVQAGVLELFREIRDTMDVGILLISHDIGVIAQSADRVAVMLDGQIVEEGAVGEVLLEPRTDYTRMLLDSVPVIKRRAPRDQGDLPPSGAAPSPDGAPLLGVEQVGRSYRSRGRTVHAVRDVSLEVRHGEVLGVVGESGSGKSTLAKLLVRLEKPNTGRLTMQGRDYRALRGRFGLAFRRSVQMVFQHPAGSLNPKLRIAGSVREPLVASGTDRRTATKRAGEMLAEVGLPPGSENRYPDEFSGGQKQRIAIARAISADPKVVILDEPTSALDVSVQAQVLRLLSRVQQDKDLTYVFISHDLAVVQAISDRVAVMYAGRLVELAGSAQLFAAPAHWYTEALLAAIPSPDPRNRSSPPGPAVTRDAPGQSAPACAFAPRCPRAEQRCRTHLPELARVRPGQSVACHFPREAAPPPGEPEGGAR